ncbi:DUF1616 domain-containing protein [Streptomyces sp. NPDC020141]|uniref:DUF1616 domain-containing protein n=1 Tax=Streptomyces sp. NPDC020141 TaxID=3365065 RepID=UPI0037904C52
MTPRHRALALRALPAAGGWLAMAATALPDASAIRVAPVALFLLLGPGAALLRLCGPALSRHRAIGPAESWDEGFERDSDRIERLVLAVGLSLSAAVVCSTALIAAEAFSGLRVLAVLAVLTTAAVCAPRPAPGGKRRSSPAAPPPLEG